MLQAIFTWSNLTLNVDYFILIGGGESKPILVFVCTSFGHLSLIWWNIRFCASLTTRAKLAWWRRRYCSNASKPRRRRALLLPQPVSAIVGTRPKPDLVVVLVGGAPWCCFCVRHCQCPQIHSETSHACLWGRNGPCKHLSNITEAMLRIFISVSQKGSKSPKKHGASLAEFS